MLRSEITPILLAHIAGGAVAILAAVTAISARKGSPLHRGAGNIFVIAMLTGASSAAWLGYNASPRDPGDVVAGVLTIYLVSTAWVSAKRADKEFDAFEVMAFLIVAAGAAASFLFTSIAVANGTALLRGVPGYIFSSVAAFTALLDLSVIRPRPRGAPAHRAPSLAHAPRLLCRRRLLLSRPDPSLS